MLMAMVALLDLTVDAAINNIDPNATLKVCLAHQEEIWNMADKVQMEAKKIPVGPERDALIEAETRKIQKEIRLLAREDLMKCVGEV